MKTKLIIEIESPDLHEIFPEAGMSDDDFKGADKQEELKDHRIEFSKGFHKWLIEYIKSMNDMEKGKLGDYFGEDVAESEYGVEDWFELSDYDAKITIKEAKP